MGLEKRYGFVYVNRNDDRIDAAAKKEIFLLESECEPGKWRIPGRVKGKLQIK